MAKTIGRRLLAIALLCGVSATARAQNYAAAFLEIPLGARSLALGGQFTPIDNHDGSAFYWNPSAVALVEGQLVSTMYSNQFGTLGDPLSHYFHLGYSQNLGGGVGLSFNWIRNSVPNIPLNESAQLNPNDPFDFQGIVSGRYNVGKFSNASDAIFITFAKNLFSRINFGWQYFNLPVDVPIGISFKYVREGFSGNRLNEFVGSNSVAGTGIGVDIGATLRFNVNDFVGSKSLGMMAIGFAIRDLFNTPITWNTPDKGNNKAAIPRATTLSLSYQQPLPFLSSSVLGVISRDTRYKGVTSIGAEYRYRSLIALRVGSLDRQLTLGAGLSLIRGLFIDYGYQNSELGSPHRVSLSVRLDEWL
ncbi:MAG: hypothetical protein RMM16_00230 [Chloroherpetonaceae bacterium]|nr:hypothetical protein [Chloroherpetonaceae bacterium]